MTAQLLTEEVAALPPEARRQVEEFVAFLRQKHARPVPAPSVALKDEPFIGMWRDRDDMKDSSAWGRELRKSEMEPRS